MKIQALSVKLKLLMLCNLIKYLVISKIYYYIIQDNKQPQMKKSGTLPSIKQKQSALTNKSKQTYRRLQNKVNTHDQEIIKNDKVISNLANQFRMLKEKLQFQQEYTEKYKIAIEKYEEEAVKANKIIKEQKITISKLEIVIKDREKIIQIRNREIKACKEKIQEHQKTIIKHQKSIQELQKVFQQCHQVLSKREEQIIELQSQKEALKKQLKQKNKQLKEKQSAIRKQYESKYQSYQKSKDQKIKALQRQIELLNSVVENGKQNLLEKEKQLQKMVINAFNLQQKLQTREKDEELKLKNYGQEMKLLTQLNQQHKRQLNQQEKTVQELQSTVKSLSAKNQAAFSEKMKQFNLQKKDLVERLSQLQSKFDDLIRTKQVETDQKHKAELQLKNQIQDFEGKLSKLTKSKESISKQLNKLKANTMCDFCNKAMKNPVTNIPCGHSYCQQCKKGYQKECKKCPGEKREAVYRNQLLEEIIQATSLVQQIVMLIPS